MARQRFSRDDEARFAAEDLAAPKPILFSGEMVRAILDGRKTQTRRVVHGRARSWLEDSGFAPSFVALPENGLSPYSYAGDRLWVREAFRGPGHIGDGDQGSVGYGIEYAADGAFRPHGDCGCEGSCGGVLISHPLRPSIHMPRWASRITLEITGVRVERLQDISEADARAEGITDSFPPHECNSERPFAEGYRWLWDSINSKRAWASNPWVWVVEFKPCEVRA